MATSAIRLIMVRRDARRSLCFSFSFVVLSSSCVVFFFCFIYIVFCFHLPDGPSPRIGKTRQ
jgi:hypothetical protein